MHFTRFRNLCRTESLVCKARASLKDIILAYRRHRAGLNDQEANLFRLRRGQRCHPAPLAGGIQPDFGEFSSLVQVVNGTNRISGKRFEGEIRNRLRITPRFTAPAFVVDQRSITQFLEGFRERLKIRACGITRAMNKHNSGRRHYFRPYQGCG